jgi:hypothetical protein
LLFWLTLVPLVIRWIDEAGITPWPVASFGVVDVAKRKLARTEDRGQEIVEVVGEAAGELAERFHLLRAEERFAALLEPKLRLSLLRHVASDLPKADQVSVVAADGVEDHACPEAGAVLAHAPALGLVAARRAGGFDRLGWDAHVDVLRRIEAAEMLSDDLVGTITLDAFRAGVPVGDLAFGIEHEDSVVGDALDEQPEPALGIEEGLLRLLRLALVGHVAGDLGEADKLAVLAVDAVDDYARPEARAVLADAPAFAFELAFRARGFEHLFRKPGGAVLLGIEFGEMLTDDLFGLKPLDPLGTSVPAGHEPFRVKHVDRIIDDRLDQ